jgi:peroxiredoxin
MKRPGAIGFVALMLVLGILYAWFRLSSELGNWENPTTIITVETAKHVVTPSMAEASRGMVFRQAPAFTLKATDGAEYSLGELIREGPLLLTFIKIGCPCSEAAQPYFNRLRAAYPHVRIFGVIDGDLGPANLWAKKIRVSYPLLLDPNLQLVRAYGVENSAYVVLVDQKGQITMHWPG